MNAGVNRLFTVVYSLCGSLLEEGAHNLSHQHFPELLISKNLNTVNEIKAVGVFHQSQFLAYKNSEKRFTPQKSGLHLGTFVWESLGIQGKFFLVGGGCCNLLVFKEVAERHFSNLGLRFCVGKGMHVKK